MTDIFGSQRWSYDATVTSVGTSATTGWLREIPGSRMIEFQRNKDDELCMDQWGWNIFALGCLTLVGRSQIYNLEFSRYARYELSLTLTSFRQLSLKLLFSLLHWKFLFLTDVSLVFHQYYRLWLRITWKSALCWTLRFQECASAVKSIYGSNLSQNVVLYFSQWLTILGKRQKKKKMKYRLTWRQSLYELSLKRPTTMWTEIKAESSTGKCSCAVCSRLRSAERVVSRVVGVRSYVTVASTTYEPTHACHVIER